MKARSKSRGRYGRGGCFECDGGWQAVHSFGSDPVTKKRRRITAWAPTEAEAWARLDEKKKALDNRPASGSGHTVESWSLEWLTYLEVARGNKQSSLDAYRARLRLHVIPALGHVRLADLTGRLIDETLQGWAAAGMGQAMRKLVYGVLRALLIHAVRKDRLTVSPHTKADRLRTPPTPLKKLWSDDERGRFLEWTRINAPRDHPFCVLALATGARASELLGLTWAKVRDGSVLFDEQLNADVHGRISDERPLREVKTPKSAREVPISAHVQTILANLRGDASPGAWVFPREDGKPQQRARVRDRFVRHCELAGVPKQTLHSMRHMNASKLLEDGVQPDLVQRRLGHADLRITLGTYSHLTPAQHRAGADAADALVKTEPSLKLIHGG